MQSTVLYKIVSHSQFVSTFPVQSTWMVRFSELITIPRRTAAHVSPLIRAAWSCVLRLWRRRRVLNFVVTKRREVRFVVWRLTVSHVVAAAATALQVVALSRVVMWWIHSPYPLHLGQPFVQVVERDTVRLVSVIIAAWFHQIVRFRASAGRHVHAIIRTRFTIVRVNKFLMIALFVSRRHCGHGGAHEWVHARGQLRTFLRNRQLIRKRSITRVLSNQYVVMCKPWTITGSYKN